MGRWLTAGRLVTMSKAAFLHSNNSQKKTQVAASQWLAMLAEIRQNISWAALGCIRTVFPGLALHEKGIHEQKRVGPLVSSQERRVAVVLVISRSSTARRVLQFGLHRISYVCTAEELSSTVEISVRGIEMERR